MGKQVIGDSFQKVKFVLALTGCPTEDQHYGFKTIHSAKDQALLCYYCLGNTEQWGSKRKGSQYENDFIEVCRKKHWLGAIAWQVTLQWWPAAPVDFYHFPSCTAFQIDGEGHFTGQFGEDRKCILKRDLKCCLHAASANGRIVRISHRNMTSAALVDIIYEAINSTCEHFIVLSAAFGTAGWKEEAKQFYYKDVLLQKLVAVYPGAKCTTLGHGCIWYTW